MSQRQLTCSDCDGAGFCTVHQLVKTAHYTFLCRTDSSYRLAWDMGQGPLQEPIIPSPKPSTTHHQGGVGTELKILLKRLGIQSVQGCQCDQRALAMDDEGIPWCERHIDKIVDWLEEEAKRRRLPFLRVAGKTLVRWAIRNAKKKKEVYR